MVAAAELQKAARNGNLRLVRQLLARNASPDAQDVDGWTCLHAAAVEGNTAVVRFLCGENTDASKSELDMAVHASEDENVNVGSELVDINITTACGRTALYFAAMDGSTECVHVLLEHGADPLIRCKEGSAPLDVAILFEHIQVQELLEQAIDCPRQPIKRRPKGALPSTAQKSNMLSSAEAAERESIPYVPPEPDAWRKLDFTKWGNISDRDLDAIDAYQERASEDADRKRKESVSSAAVGQRAVAEAGRVCDLPYGDGRIGPPKKLPPAHPRYQEYKEWLDIQEEVKRARNPAAGAVPRLDESERLLSFKPPSEGGAAPDAHNGSHGLGYTWGQTPAEIHIWIVMQEGARAQDVSCEIAPASLSLVVARRRQNAAPRRDTIFGNDALWRRIKADESMWTLEQGLLTLTLRKVESGWWRCVTDGEGHTKIDTSLCRGPDMLADYEDIEQAELRAFFGRQLSRRL